MAVISGEEMKTLPHKSFVDVIYSMRERGKEIFVEESQTKSTASYEEFHNEISRVAATVRKLGIRPGNIVTVLADNSIRSFAFVYGVILSGARVSPINPELKKLEVTKMMESSRPSLIYCDNDKYAITVSEAVNTLKLDTKIFTSSQFQELLVPHEVAVNFKPPEIDSASHIYMVLYTSGTTGIPKGVQLRDQATISQCTNMNWVYGNFLLSSPLYWISNTIMFAKAIVDGLKVVITDVASPERCLDIIHQYKVKSWFGGPSVVLDMCILQEEKKYDITSLEYLFTGGSHIPLEQKLYMKRTLLNGNDGLRIVFGSTETGVISEWKGPLDPEKPEYASLGTLIPGVQLKVVDVNTGETLGPGKHGEFCVKTVNMMAGYLDEQLTKAGYDDEGWWHLGDIGYIDDNGYVYYVSRLKDIFKYRGIQIAPVELETILLQRPEVFEVCVLGKPHPIDGEWPTAFVILKPKTSVNEKELEEFVAAQVPDSKRLRGGVHIVKSFPLSGVGKILAKDLLKLLD